MAEYEDITKIEALYAEQAELSQALTLLDDHDGIVTMFSISLPPPPQTPTPQAPIPPPPPTTMIMGATIMTVEPKQNLMAAAHAYCTQRFNAINKELKDLGVTGTPPDAASGGGGGGGGGPPHATATPAGAGRR